MRKPLPGLSDMVGSKGKVVSALSPSGMVNIRGELWDASPVGTRLEAGVEVEVVGQEGLKLVVRKLERPAGDKR